jgi:hypothetical protein
MFIIVASGLLSMLKPEPDKGSREFGRMWVPKQVNVAQCSDPGAMQRA